MSKLFFCYYCILLIFSTLLFTCTENPFSSDDGNTKDKYVLSGKIQLSDGLIANNVYIWMEKLQLNTWTNTSGDFRLPIPRTDDYAGYTDTCRVYFYLGNYAYQTREVFIREGAYVFGEMDISGNGSLRENVVLSKLLDISMYVDPEIVPGDEGGALDVRVEALANDVLVTVQTYQLKDSSFSSILCLPESGETSDAVLIKTRGAALSQRTVSHYLMWTGKMFIPGDTLALGKYEIIPYVQVKQSGLPLELIASLGENAHKFHHEFLNIPFNRNNATLEIN